MAVDVRKVEIKTLCDALLAEFGEKIVLVRHDVDNLLMVYEPLSLLTLAKRVINFTLLEMSSMSPKLITYLPFVFENVLEVFDLEKAYGAKATWFFRPITVPSRRIVLELLSKGHEIGYHSDRNYSFDTFYRDLKLVEKLTGVKVYGFTKHGISKIRSGGYVPLERLIAYGVKAGLVYFAQGVSFPEMEIPCRIRNLWIFGHHITLKKVKPAVMVEYLSKKCLPMVLVHPEDVRIPGEMAKFEYLLSKFKTVPFITVITKISKIITELLENDNNNAIS